MITFESEPTFTTFRKENCGYCSEQNNPDFTLRGCASCPMLLVFDMLREPKEGISLGSKQREGVK